jgi:large subunit ribosomal protein L29
MRDSYRDLTFAELLQKKEEITQKYRSVRFNMIVGHVDNPLEKRTLRRKLARLNTLIYNHEEVVGGGARSEE